MRRKAKGFWAILAIISCIVVYCYTEETMYERIVKESPEEIHCASTTADNVTLLGEYIAIVSENGAGIRGVASFEKDGKIYLFGHSIEKPIGSLVFKVGKAKDEIKLSNLMGEVISNDKNGIIAEEYQKLGEYSTIPIAKSIRLGEAFLVERDDEGNIHQYPITIEAFSQEKDMFFYSSPEMQIENGISGMPIVQNNELIGVHYGRTKKRDIGRIIWNLDMVIS